MRFGRLKNNIDILIKGNSAFTLKSLGFKGSLLGLIESGNEVLTEIISLSKNLKPDIELKNENLAAPYDRPSKIIAVGLNYSNHAAETKMEVPKSPLIFAKFGSSIIGSNDEIKIPLSLTNKVDYEAELGIIIGKKAKNVLKENALEYVFGYTVLNDVSARDLQFSDKQWVRAKSLDTFCPFGPHIVTKDEIADPNNLDISCEVNGELLQNDNTKNMIFSVEDLVSQISSFFTLMPGDIIASGTPGGVGFSRKPPVYLHHGDIVKTRIEKIGELVNPVVEI